MEIYGYIRVSSIDQNEDRQLLAMQELNISATNIFVDKQSGKDFKRVEYPFTRLNNNITHINTQSLADAVKRLQSRLVFACNYVLPAAKLNNPFKMPVTQVRNDASSRRTLYVAQLQEVRLVYILYRFRVLTRCGGKRVQPHRPAAELFHHT